MPTRSEPKLPPSAALELAVDRAQLLMGCYRRADWHNPDIAFRAFVSVFARFPESVVTAVTEPATGIPSKIKWPPTIAEVVDACKTEMAPILRDFDRQMVAYRGTKLLAPPPSAPKMTIEEMEAKLGRPLSGWVRPMGARFKQEA